MVGEGRERVTHPALVLLSPRPTMLGGDGDNMDGSPKTQQAQANIKQWCRVHACVT